NQNAAYSVGATFLVRNRNQFFLIDVCRERLAYTDLKRRVIQLADQQKPHWIIIEGKSSGTPLNEELKRRGVNKEMAPLPERDKGTRMRQHSLILEANKLHIPRHAPWRGDFLTEYLSFPNSRTTDIIDAMSQFFEWHRAHSAQTPFSYFFIDPWETDDGAL